MSFAFSFSLWYDLRLFFSLSSSLKVSFLFFWTILFPFSWLSTMVRYFLSSFSSCLIFSPSLLFFSFHFILFASPPPFPPETVDSLYVSMYASLFRCFVFCVLLFCVYSTSSHYSSPLPLTQYFFFFFFSFFGNCVYVRIRICISICICLCVYVCMCVVRCIASMDDENI